MINGHFLDLEVGQGVPSEGNSLCLGTQGDTNENVWHVSRKTKSLVHLGQNSSTLTLLTFGPGNSPRLRSCAVHCSYI